MEGLPKPRRRRSVWKLTFPPLPRWLKQVISLVLFISAVLTAIIVWKIMGAL